MTGDYPKLKFHVRGGGSITVTSAAQEKALGPEWVDHKALTGPAKASPAPVPEATKLQNPRTKKAKA